MAVLTERGSTRSVPNKSFCALPGAISTTSTSTASNYYTGLIETSKTHFYGRAAAELSFSEGILRTFTGVREAVSFSHCNTTCSVSPNMSYSARKNMKARGVCVVAASTPMTPPLAFSPRMRCALLSARRCRASEF